MEIEWETLWNFFNKLNEEFNFDVDVCATSQNTKCQHFLTLYHDSLRMPWIGTCWMNPPYKNTYAWVRKAYRSSQDGKTVVCLLRASVDTKWFHEFVMKSSEIRFVIDRIHFGKDGTFKRANHPSMVVIFCPYCVGPPIVSSIENGIKNN